jgi:hypothetical protein
MPSALRFWLALQLLHPRPQLAHFRLAKALGLSPKLNEARTSSKRDFAAAVWAPGAAPLGEVTAPSFGGEAHGVTEGALGVTEAEFGGVRRATGGPQAGQLPPAPQSAS